MGSEEVTMRAEGERLTGAEPERVQRVASRFLWLRHPPDREWGLEVEDLAIHQQEHTPLHPSDVLGTEGAVVACYKDEPPK